MADQHQPTESHYGSVVGFIYIFNLIVGTGALTIPKAFAAAGWLFSSISIVFLAFVSFITGTFMFESMAIANSLKRNKDDLKDYIENDDVDSTGFRNKNWAVNEDNDDESIFNYRESRPLMGIDSGTSDEENITLDKFDLNKLMKLFDIRTKYEMGEMAAMFFNRFGLYCFYVAMISYLYGDLAIYNAAVPKSLRDTTCTFVNENITINGSHAKLSESDPCWTSIPSLSRMNVYRIYMVIFNLLIGPMVFFNVQKTKFLQLCTTLMRWVAFITMIVLASMIIHKNRTESITNPIESSMFNIKGVPNFFGVCIYAFMCHHSLPSIITPIKNKSKFKYIFTIAYACILAFYILLAFTGIFAFGKNLNDFYTLNFEPEKDDGLFMRILHYYLSLFPVFTISASFPIIAITLRNNMISLYKLVTKTTDNSVRMIRIGFPLITLFPPLIISFITHDLQLLVGITGSYAGVTIQYIFPSLLVYFGRRESIRHYNANYERKQPYNSPFSSKYWVFFILLWAHISVIFVTVNHIINKG